MSDKLIVDYDKKMTGWTKNGYNRDCAYAYRSLLKCHCSSAALCSVRRDHKEISWRDSHSMT